MNANETKPIIVEAREIGSSEDMVDRWTPIVMVVVRNSWWSVCGI